MILVEVLRPSSILHYTVCCSYVRAYEHPFHKTKLTISLLLALAFGAIILVKDQYMANLLVEASRFVFSCCQVAQTVASVGRMVVSSLFFLFIVIYLFIFYLAGL